MTVVADLFVSLDGMAADLDGFLSDPHYAKTLEWLTTDRDANSSVINSMKSHGSIVITDDQMRPAASKSGMIWESWFGVTPDNSVPVIVTSKSAKDDFVGTDGRKYSFVQGSLKEVIAKARLDAGKNSVSIQGGTEFITHALASHLIDELNVHIAPNIIGHIGRKLFYKLPIGLTFQVLNSHHTKHVTHIKYGITFD
jgi:dihydrofolate reductase